MGEVCYFRTKNRITATTTKSATTMSPMLDLPPVWGAPLLLGVLPELAGVVLAAGFWEEGSVGFWVAGFWEEGSEGFWEAGSAAGALRSDSWRLLSVVRGQSWYCSTISSSMPTLWGLKAHARSMFDSALDLSICAALTRAR